MATRRRGEGTIYEWRDGYRGEIELERIDGRRRRKVVLGATQKEVQEKLVAVLHAHHRRRLRTGRTTRVADFLGKWVGEVDVEESTRVHYRQKVGHVIRRFGEKRLRDLQAHELDSFFKTLRRSEENRDGLSPQSVAHVRRVLHIALEKAVQYDEIDFNPVDRTSAIKVPTFHARYMQPDEALRFLKCAAGDRLEALYWVVLTLGLREGEVLGLRWSDLDLESRSWRVTHQLQRVAGKGLVLKTPKDDEVRGPWPLPKVTADALRAHRARQNAERLAAGPFWQENDLVFSTLEGRPLAASHIISNNREIGSFRRICLAAGVEYGTRARAGLRFHDLRHSAGSVLYAFGVPIKTISVVLGHSRINITADRYVHVSRAVMQEAADAMDRALGS